MLYCYVSKNFRVISNGPPTRTAETQPTDRVLPPAPHHHLANNKRQRRLYFCGEFLCPFNFLRMFYSYISKKFELSAMVLLRERPKLSPQTEFCLPSRTTALSTTTGSGVYIFSVSANFLHHFLSIFLATTNSFQFIILVVLPLE